MALEALGGGARKMTEDQLVQYCLDCDASVMNSIRNLRDRWDTNWSIYNNQFNYDQKEKWQAQAFLPKVKMAVRVVRAVMKQSLLKSAQFFSFQGLNDDSEEIAKDIEDGLSRILDQAEFKQRKFGQGLFRGLLENLIVFKIFPAELEPEDAAIHPNQEFKTVIEPVSAYDFRIDITGRGSFVIHRVTMDLSDYRRLVDQGVYRKESLLSVMAGFEAAEEEIREKVREGIIDMPPHAPRKDVELLEFWGNIDNVDGTRAYENVTMTVVNRRALARFPLKNPYDHGKPPFVWGPIFEKPGSVYHEGFLDGAIPLAKMINETLNLALDSHLASSVKAYEVNMDFVHNPTQLNSGIYPGKTIKVRGVPPGGQAIREFQLGAVNPSTMQILASLDREYQNSTGVNEFISGVVGVGDKTATETKIKTSQSQSLMQSIAGEIEDNNLEPTIEMVFSLMMQYNPEVFGTQVATMSADRLKYAFAAKGMSKILSQIDDLQKIFMWVGMVAKTPIGQQINWQELGEMSVKLINQDPKKFLINQAQQSPEVGVGPTRPDDVAAQGEQAQLAQLLQMQQGGK